MKKHTSLLIAVAVFAVSLQFSYLVGAATTIDAVNRYSYGANIGWINWVADTNHGAVIGDYVCSGYIWSANCGWMNLGSGAPANGIQYQNNSATDFGVNNDGSGNLRGFAWGANIGWINFENTGAPKVDLKTGRMSGHIWSANCGWISLSNAFAFVQTDKIDPGALSPNGLPVAWLLSNFGTTNIDAHADADGDGMSNLQEYLAGTNPNDAADKLAITHFTTTSEADMASVTWTSTLSRCYFIQTQNDLDSAAWLDSGLGLIPADGATTSRTIASTNSLVRFYRVQAVRPLTQ